MHRQIPNIRVRKHCSMGLYSEGHLDWFTGSLYSGDFNAKFYGILMKSHARKFPLVLLKNSVAGWDSVSQILDSDHL